MLTLVLGGARSGKSQVAEDRAARAAAPGGQVTYVATASVTLPGQAVDQEWVARIAAHRARRPAGWHTVEVPAGGSLAGALDAVGGVALVDSLGTWVAGLDPGGADGAAAPGPELVAALRRRRAAGLATVVVSEEVGLGGVAPVALARRFADALGELNQQVAGMCDEVLLVVAGRVLPLEPR